MRSATSEIAAIVGVDSAANVVTGAPLIRVE